jgi:prephenate dehydrogenase
MMRVGIVGLGLIGGSLGLALRKLRRAIDVIGVTRRAEGAAAAIERGAVDRASTNLADLAGCDIVVVATPIDQIAGVMQRLSPILAATALITDVASVKQPIVEAVRRLPTSARFLGGHPVAGKAQGGLEESQATLFEGEPWIFTPAAGQDVRPFDTWFEMVRALGAVVRFMPANEHDRQMAFLSHLAFTLSSAYQETIERYSDPSLGGPGYRGMVRLAAGDPAMYEAIARENREALVDALDLFDVVLNSYRKRIAEGTKVKELFKGAVHASG